MTRKLSRAEIERLWRLGVSLDYIVARSGRTARDIATVAGRRGWPERTRGGRFLDDAVLAMFDALWRAGAGVAWIETQTGLTKSEQRRLAERRGVFRPADPRERGVAPAKETPPAPRRRKCIRCPAMILSAGAHERYCPACRQFAHAAGDEGLYA